MISDCLFFDLIGFSLTSYRKLTQLYMVLMKRLMNLSIWSDRNLQHTQATSLDTPLILDFSLFLVSMWVISAVVLPCCWSVGHNVETQLRTSSLEGYATDSGLNIYFMHNPGVTSPGFWKRGSFYKGDVVCLRWFQNIPFWRGGFSCVIFNAWIVENFSLILKLARTLVMPSWAITGNQHRVGSIYEILVKSIEDTRNNEYWCNSIIFLRIYQSSNPLSPLKRMVLWTVAFRHDT
jgi:hypothetical protein